MALALEDSPAYMAGGAAVIAALFHDKDKLVAAMRGDGGLAWGDHHPCMFSGTERFSGRATVRFWSLSGCRRSRGVVAKLQAGAKVADVGCGHGASTLVMAQAFQRRRFVGYDYHGPSITTANARAREAGLSRAGGVFSRPVRRITRGMTMTWCASSIACTTWATRWGRPSMPIGR